jgi:hypothetical protein
VNGGANGNSSKTNPFDTGGINVIDANGGGSGVGLRENKLEK